MAMVLGPSNTVTANVVPANRRAAGYALFIFLIHLFGDISSPILLGWISDLFGSAGVMNSALGQFLLSIGAGPTADENGQMTNLTVAMLAVGPDPAAGLHPLLHRIALPPRGHGSGRGRRPCGGCRRVPPLRRPTCGVSLPMSFLCCASLLATLCSMPQSGGIDLTAATVVVRENGAPEAEKTAVTVLVEEAEKRTGVRWTQRAGWPNRARSSWRLRISTTSPADKTRRTRSARA